ncbi:hypothetical protein F2P81_006004 [Scophthalmus maximus]|uniref:Uncharacterized protein n=1 Tax=Scophthalmus maximus TaxID=52904 RepID=A0A6A4TKD2_SCOMX|nr:hypothetical protein F2P81_006004 [Scophthalmus maximus]
MDFVAAQHLVEGTEDNLKEHVRDFEGVKGAADEFVSWANEKLQEMDNCELVAQTALPEKRVRKKRRMPGELLDDDTDASPDAAFEVNVHNVILDTERSFPGFFSKASAWGRKWFQSPCRVDASSGKTLTMQFNMLNENTDRTPTASSGSGQRKLTLIPPEAEGYNSSSSHSS